MPTLDITLDEPTNGTSNDATPIVAAFQAIMAVVNALDNTNIAAAAGIAISKLAGYPSDSTKVLKGDGTWGAATSSGPTFTYGTSFPNSPSSGDMHTLVDSTTAPTYQWMFRYNGGSLSTYKWEFVGGAPIVVAASSTMLPAHAGDYFVTVKGYGGSGGSTTGQNQSASLVVGGTTVDTQNTSNVPASSGAVFSYGGQASNWAIGGLAGKATGASASAAVTCGLNSPVFTILPVRVI